jgi:uncharacterized membrane protein YfcA
MDLTHIIILIVAGLIGGTLSAVIGGASLLTFPALLATGIPPVNAAACNLAALVPCNFLAAIADRTQLPPLNRSFGLLVFGSVVGAGVGVLLLAVLSIGTGGDYRSANVTKNLVTSLNSTVAAGIMIVQGAVYWPQTIAMMSGAVAGGLIGSWLARVMPRQLIRILIIVVGALLTAYFAHLYWF